MTGQIFHCAREVIPHGPWKSKAPLQALLPDKFNMCIPRACKECTGGITRYCLHSFPLYGPLVVQYFRSLTCFNLDLRTLTGFQLGSRNHWVTRCCIVGFSSRLLFIISPLCNCICRYPLLWHDPPFTCHPTHAPTPTHTYTHARTHTHTQDTRF